MGTACFSQPNKKSHLQDIKFGQEKLVFKIVISGIKVKNIQQQSAYVLVKMSEHTFKTSMIRYNQNPHWPEQFTLDLHIEPSSMQNEFFLLQIFDDSHKIRYKLKYSIYEIASGPQHHDILCDNKASIIFDVKVAQKLHLKINAKQIRCVLDDQLGDTAYSFLMKIKSQDNESQSAISPKYINPTYQNEELPYSYKSFQSSSQRYVSTKKALEAKNEIVWEFRLEDSPALEFDVFADYFQITTFIFILYAHYQAKDIEYKRIGSTYISFNKLFYDDTSLIAQTDTLIIQEAQLKESLIADGINIGLWCGSFIIKSNLFVSQCTGVKTEDGIVNQSTLLLKKAKNKNTVNKEGEWLIGLKIKLEELSKCTREKKIKEAEKIRTQILEDIKDNHAIKYQNLNDILQSQQTQIKLWKYLLDQIHTQTEMVKEFYFSVLSELLYRDDMDLDHLSIDDQEERLHLAQIFLQLLIKYMPICLTRVIDSSCSAKEHHFFIKFAVLVYFRIPKFRYSLFSNKIINDKNDIHKFYSFVFSNEKGKQLQKELEQLNIKLPQNDLPLFLYPFIVQWIGFVQKKFGPIVIWESIDGYEEIVGLLLSNIQSKNQQFLEASCAILQNSMLLSQFIQIVFTKTKLYDASQVYNSLNLIDIWLHKVYQNYHILPTNFDYPFFFKGIKLILNGDHAVSISKSLQILYNHFHLLPTEPKKELCDFIFNNELFFKIFMHWSQLVRFTFSHLLIFRIQHRHKSLQSKFDKIRDLKKELQYAFFTDNLQKERDVLVNDMIYLKYSYNMQIMRKINQLFTSHQTNNQYVQKVIQEKSLKAKLIKKKAKEKKELDQEYHGEDSTTMRNSSRKGEVPELSFQSQVSKAQSAIGFGEKAKHSLKSLDEDENNEKNNISIKGEDEQEFPVKTPIEFEGQSFSSFIDLNKILQEVEEEQENSTKYRRNQKVLKGCHSPKNKIQQQDAKILARKFPDMEFESTGLKAQYMKYLPLAYADYLNVQQVYQRWLTSMKLNFKDQNQFDKVKDHQVPKLEIRIPKDESNQEAGQSDD